MQASIISDNILKNQKTVKFRGGDDDRYIEGQKAKNPQNKEKEKKKTGYVRRPADISALRGYKFKVTVNLGLLDGREFPRFTQKLGRLGMLSGTLTGDDFIIKNYYPDYREYANSGAEGYTPKSAWERELYPYLDPKGPAEKRNPFVLNRLGESKTDISKWITDPAIPADPYLESKREFSKMTKMIRDMQAEADAEEARRTADINKILADFHVATPRENFINIIKEGKIIFKYPPKEPRDFDLFKRDTEPKMNPNSELRKAEESSRGSTDFDFFPNLKGLYQRIFGTPFIEKKDK